MIIIGFILLWIAVLVAAFLGCKFPTFLAQMRANDAKVLFALVRCACGVALVVCIVCFGAFMIYSAGKADALAPHPSGSGTSSATSLLVA